MQNCVHRCDSWVATTTAKHPLQGLAFFLQTAPCMAAVCQQGFVAVKASLAMLRGTPPPPRNPFHSQAQACMQGCLYSMPACALPDSCVHACRYVGIKSLEPVGVFLPGEQNYPGGTPFDPLGFAQQPDAFVEQVRVHARTYCHRHAYTGTGTRTRQQPACLKSCACRAHRTGRPPVTSNHTRFLRLADFGPFSPVLVVGLGCTGGQGDEEWPAGHAGDAGLLRAGACACGGTLCGAVAVGVVAWLMPS